MTRDDALLIIDSHGGDPARWPEADRAALLALAATDAEVAAAVAAARRLDAMLGEWAGREPVAAFDFDAMTRVPQERAPAALRPWPLRWIGSGALAAAMMAGLFVYAPAQQPVEIASVSTSSPVLSATAEGSAYGSDAEVFASVFTPTADEEELI